MTNDTQILNDADLENVCGGASLIRTSTIDLPHIAQAKDLLTSQQIANLLSPHFHLPITHG